MKTAIIILVICACYASAAPPFVQAFQKNSRASNLQCQNGDKVFQGDKVVWQKDVANITCKSEDDVCGLMSMAFTWTEDGNTQHLTQAIGFCAPEKYMHEACVKAKKEMPEQGKIQKCNVKSCDKDLCNDLVPNLPESEYFSSSAVVHEENTEGSNLKCQNGDKVFKGDKVVWEKDVANITCKSEDDVCGLMSLAFTWTEDGQTQRLTQAIGFCAPENYMHGACDEAKKDMPEQGKIQKCNVKSCDKDLCNDLVPSLPPSDDLTMTAETDNEYLEGSLMCQNGDKVYNAGKVVWQKDVKNITCPTYATVCGLMSMAFTYTEDGHTDHLTQAYGFCTTEDYLQKACDEAKKEMPKTTKVEKCNVKSCDKDLCNDLVPSFPKPEYLTLVV